MNTTSDELSLMQAKAMNMDSKNWNAQHARKTADKAADKLKLERAENGGWIVYLYVSEGCMSPFHTFTSSEDMLNALPRLVGYDPGSLVEKLEDLHGGAS